MKIGLIAGGGDLPKNVVSGAKQAQHDVEIIAIEGFASGENFDQDVHMSGIGEFGKIVKTLKKAECTHVCFAGYIKRPDFLKMKRDLKGLMKMPGAIMAARRGDSALLEYVLKIFEDEGFTVIPPQDLCAELLLGEGHLGAISLTEPHMGDAKKACETASNIAAMDIGQSVIVCRGLVLAVEAQEGTDAVIDRVLSLPEDVRGTKDKPEGVLAKITAPDYDSRVDLPTIGVETVLRAKSAGLAGIVAESGYAFVIDKAAVITAADEAGIFIAGLPPSNNKK